MKKYLQISLLILSAFIMGAVVRSVVAGSLTSPGEPANTMYSLEDIYNLANDSTTADEGSGTIPETPNNVSETGVTLTQVYDAVASALASAGGGLLTTGQTGCWNASGGLISCAGTGQDGQYLKGTARSYTDNSNSTITDDVTGLMWKQCSEGLSGTDCATGSATTLNWTTALSTCEADTTGGHTDWRLPNRFELESLVNLQAVNPSIDTDFFLGTQSGSYWSSTSYQGPGSERYAWDVYFGDGGISTGGKTGKDYVRCVR